MQKLILASSLTLLSGAAMADHCDVEFDGTLTLENRILTVTTVKDDEVRIDEDHRLFVNGSEVDLSSQNQEWVSNYYQGITDAAPQVAEIAIDGIAIASEAVNLVFGELLGTDSSAISDLTYKLEEMSAEIEHNFYADDGTIRINSGQFEGDEFFGEAWEAEFEAAIEEAIASSMGRILIAIGSELLWNGGDMEAFEARMENFGNDIEAQMEAKAEVLEEKAEVLCMLMAEVDFAETQLQNSVDELQDLDILRVNHHSNAM